MMQAFLGWLAAMAASAITGNHTYGIPGEIYGIPGESFALAQTAGTDIVVMAGGTVATTHDSAGFFALLMAMAGAGIASWLLWRRVRHG